MPRPSSTLLQKEVTEFVATIIKQGIIIVSSIHNEWLCDDPNLIYVNIEDVDDPLNFARKVRKSIVQLTKFLVK